MADWSRVAKLAGMLGSLHDGERLNAARLLQRELEKAKLSFGDLSGRIENGGNGSSRTVIVERRIPINGSAKVAQKILDNGGDKLDQGAKRFLRSILRNNDWTGGNYDLSCAQANWLARLEQQYSDRPASRYKASKPGPIPQWIREELGV